MTTPKFAVLVYVEGIGDITVGPDEYAGARDKNKSVDGFQITLSQSARFGLRYMAHFAGSGDTDWVSDGVFVGSRTANAALEGFAIELTGDDAGRYNVLYKAYRKDGSETAWCSNGALCGTRGATQSLYAIVVKLTPRFKMLVHVHDIGDMTVDPDELAGTDDKNKPIEGFQIDFPTPVGLGLRYMAHISKTGDTGWITNGNLAGSRGQSAAVEGFAIELTGEKFTEYDILYMAYNQSGVETGWFANGAFCGTRGQSLGLIGMVVRLAKRSPNYVSIVSKARAHSGRMLVITGRPLDNAVTVEAPGDEAWQSWDKRPVKAGQGYMLISKADPTKCIARRGGREPTALADIRTAKLDDCIWRDDTVRGRYNAINCWTDWELKLNVRGNPPYRDRGTTLLTWPWACGADNELWRTAAQTYNVVAGGDEVALNGVAQAIYRGCYPSVFRESLTVGREGLNTVGFDITTPPVLRLAPSALYEQQLESMQAVSAMEKAALRQANAASFSARADHVKLKIGGKITAEVEAVLDASAAVHFDPDNRLTLRLNSGVLHIQEGQVDEITRIALEGALNLAFLPLLLDYLNKNILERIAIPKLELNGIQFAAPVISLQQPYLLGSTSMAPDTVFPPPASRWPQRRLFCGVDTPALEAVAASFLKDISPRDRWSANLGIGSVSAEYYLEFKNPSFIVSGHRGNTYQVRIDVSGGANFKFLGIGPSADADGFVLATASVVVTPERKVKIVFRSLDFIVVNWHFGGLPPFIDDAISVILNAFNPVIMGVVTLALGGKEFDVYTIPEIDTTIGGRKVTITLQGLALDSMEDGGRKPLVLACGDVDVKLH
jgi:uncharacterized protein YjdB